MALESGVSYIDDLVVTNPESTDAIAEGDDHLRNIKTAVTGSFTSLGREAVTKTAAEINDLAQSTSGTLTNPTLTNPTLTNPIINNPTISGDSSNITINGVTDSPMFVPLATPSGRILSTAIDTNTLYDMSANLPEAATAGARWVRILVQLTSTNSGASPRQAATFHAHSTPPTTSFMKLQVENWDYSGNYFAAKGSIECIVPLDTNSDFYWYHRNIFGANTGTTDITIVGYYV